MHLVGYLYEDYYDARSLEHQVSNYKSLPFYLYTLYNFYVRYPWRVPVCAYRSVTLLSDVVH
jgi:hypothetical protein